MGLDILKQNELFESYKQGYKTKIHEILDLEKAYLYDFLLRMTGDQAGALAALEQAQSLILSCDESWASLNGLRLGLYRHAREQMREVWNADVSKLEHPSLSQVLKNPDSGPRAVKRAKAYKRLNRAITTCDGNGREIILLHLCNKFTFSEVGELIGQSREFVEENYGDALGHITATVPELKVDPRKVIGNLEVYPLPRTEDTRLSDLSGLMGAIERERKASSANFAFYGFLLLILLGGSFFFTFLMLNPSLAKIVSYWLKLQFTDF